MRTQRPQCQTRHEYRTDQPHVEVPADVTLGEAHRRSSAFISAAHERFASLHEIVTHIEPAVRRAEAEQAGRGETEETSCIVRQVAADWCESCHKVLVRQLQDELSLSLHCQMAPDTPIEEAHDLSQRLESALRVRIPRLDRVVIHMEPVGAEPQHGDALP